MKKVIALILSCTMLSTAMIGCGSKAPESTASKASEPAPASSAVASSSSESTAPFDGSAETADKEVVKAIENYNITLIVKNLMNPMWTSVYDGAREAAEAAGCTLTVLAPTTADNNEQQIGLLEQSIAKGEDAIVLVPADGTGIVPGVEEANNAGIPVIDVNTKVDTSTGAKVETFVGVENYDAACDVAEALSDMLGKTGEIIVLEGKAGASSSVDIVKGANDTFAQYSDIKVVASQTADWSRDKAMTVTENLLQANPNVSAIFAANDEMAMGALKAVQEAGKAGKILITGLDANDDAKAAVDAGDLAATCDKNGYGQGWAGLMAAVKKLNGEALDERIVVPTSLYVK